MNNSTTEKNTAPNAPHKPRYVFAWTFIRLGIFLAVLSLLAGVGFAVLSGYKYVQESSSLQYRANENLGLQVEQIAKTYEGTKDRLLRSLDAQAFPSTVTVVDVTALSKNQLPASSAKKLDGLAETLKTTAQSVEQMKRFHVAGLEEGINALRQNLLAQAEEIRKKHREEVELAKAKQEKELQSAASTAATPVATPIPPVSPEPVTSNQPTKFRIFVDAPMRDDWRNDVISNAKDYLEKLKEKTKKEENQAAIRKALIYLMRADSLLDLGKTSELPKPEASVVKTDSEEKQDAGEYKAEALAQDLKNLLDKLHEQLYTQWKIDALLYDLQASVNTERDKVIVSELAMKKLRIETAISIVKNIVGAIVVAFALLVLMDFLRAFLNLSNNSDALRRGE